MPVDHETAASGRRSTRGSALLVLLSYVAVLGACTLPWLAQAADRIVQFAPGSRPDTRLHIWILWWVSHALTTEPSALFDAPINYPTPLQLTGSEHFLTDQLVFTPVFVLTGNPLLALNVVLLLSYPLAAFAMNRFLMALEMGAAAAWAGGLLFALGPLTTPPSTHLLHNLAFFLPLAALCLTRLREQPTATRGFVLAAVFLLGFLSAYYMAAMLLVGALVWGTSEAMRPLPDRARFVRLAFVAALVGVAMLGVLSLPYLDRGEVWDFESRREVANVRLQRIAAGALLLGPQKLLGVWLAVPAALGLLALVEPKRRRLAGAGLALVAAGMFFTAGGLDLLERLSLPGALGELAALPGRFFRLTMRFMVLAGFGAAILATAFLDLAMRRLPRPFGFAIVAAIVLLLLADRGVALFSTAVEPIDALSRDAETYRVVGRITAKEGPGPLLELPTRDRGRNLEAEAMVGSIWHRQPLITGHTGYLPPRRIEVNEKIRALPALAALDGLQETTGLRWILIRPPVDEIARKSRDDLVRTVVGSPSGAHVWEIEDWTLVQLGRGSKVPERAW